MKTHFSPLAASLAAALALAACAGGPVNPLVSQAITVDSLLYVAEVFIGDTVTVRGTAILPSESGTTDAFLVSDSAHTSEIRVLMDSPIDIEAGEIATGDAVIVRGQLQEQRITRQDIEAKAHEVDSLAAAGAITTDVQQKTLNAIEAKKAFMHYTGRTYYSVFSIHGALVTVL